MTRSSKLVLNLVAVIALSACTQRVADLTLVSTKNIDFAATKIDHKAGKREKADDCRVSILGIPFGFPNIETAVDKALAAGGGNIMVDEVTEIKSTFFLVGTYNCVVVEGTVIAAQPHQAPQKQ